MYSKYGKIHGGSGKEIEKIIKDVARKNPKIKLMLIITSGAFLDLILEEIPEISNFADLLGKFGYDSGIKHENRGYQRLVKAGIRCQKPFSKILMRGKKLRFP